MRSFSVRYALVVRHHHDRRLLQLVQFPQVGEHFLSGSAVEFAGGFIGEDEFRAFEQSPGDGHPLLLAPGELVGAMIEPAAQTDPAEKLHRPPPEFLGNPARQKGHEDILDGRQIAEQIEALKNKAHIGSAVFVPLAGGQSREPFAVDNDLAGGRFIERPDQIQQRALSAPRWPDDKRERSPLDFAAHAPQRVHLRLASLVDFGDILNLYHHGPLSVVR